VSRPRRAARTHNLEPLAKAGFIARGVVYILIGAPALAIALGKPAPEADRTGALQPSRRSRSASWSSGCW